MKDYSPRDQTHDHFSRPTTTRPTLCDQHSTTIWPRYDHIVITTNYTTTQATHDELITWPTIRRIIHHLTKHTTILVVRPLHDQHFTTNTQPPYDHHTTTLSLWPTIRPHKLPILWTNYSPLDQSHALFLDQQNNYIIARPIIQPTFLHTSMFNYYIFHFNFSRY